MIWSDEKWFVLTQSSNRKNSCTWAPYNPNNLEQCKKQGGAKVMAWVGMVDGQILPIHWFEGSVNGEKYLDMLKNVVWPAVRSKATRRGYWMQQDGATPHIRKSVMDFLKSKFGDNLISRNSTHIWPPYSPDLSPLDFSFWSLAMSEVTRTKPESLTALKEVVEDFALNMDEELVRKICRNVKRGLNCGRLKRGGNFEHLL